jgi:hypothetical protein
MWYGSGGQLASIIGNEGILSYKEIEQVQPERSGLVRLQPPFKMQT